MGARVHVWISGRVQGVGYRFSTARRARELSLGGWVRNLPDGRVEAEFEGTRDHVEVMVAWCREGPAFASVSHVATQWEPEPAGHDSFRVCG